MTEMNDALDRVMEEANSIFKRMGAVIDEAIAGGATKLDVAEVAQQAGAKIDLDRYTYRLYDRTYVRNRDRLPPL